MSRAKFIGALIAGLLAVVSVVPAQPSGQPLTNKDVISMVKNGLSENVVLGAIKTNDTNFDVSSNALIALKKAGVSSRVMEAMIQAANAKKNGPATSATAPGASAPDSSGGASSATGLAPSAVATPPAAAAGSVEAPAGSVPSSQSMVSIIQGGSAFGLPAEATQIVQTKAKANTLSALAKDQALNEALNIGTQAAQQAVMKSVLGATAVGSGAKIIGGIMSHRKQNKITYVWALQGTSSAASMGSGPAIFDVNFASLPGVNPEAFEPVIVKLALTQSNFRLVGATEAATNAEQSTQQDWPIYSSFVEDRVSAKIQKLAPGHAQVTSAAALAPGEYAIALRPIDKSHKFSGEQVAKNQGEGLLFNYTWSFSIK